MTLRRALLRHRAPRRPARRPRRVAAHPGHQRPAGRTTPTSRPSAEWFAEAVRRTGFPIVEIWQTRPACRPSSPSGRATTPAPRPCSSTATTTSSRSTRSSCGTPTRSTRPIDGDVLRARGASDDKGQLLFHLLGLRAHLAATGRTTPGGAPEVPHRGRGGVRLAELRGSCCAERRDRLDCDVVVITDTGMIADGRARAPSPACAAWSPCTVAFHGPDLDLHSGVFGGAVPNPATAIARLVAALHDDDGRVQVPGFYDDVARADRRRARAVRQGARSTTPSSSTVAKSRALRRRGRVHARSSGSAPGRPPRSTASAAATRATAARRSCRATRSSSCRFRLVADQEPGKIRGGVERVRRRPHARPASIADVEWEGDGVAPCLVADRHPGLPRADRRDQRGLRRRAGAADPRGRQRARRPRSQQVARRAAGVPRRRAARRPDPRAEREGHPVDALQGRRGGGAAVAGAGRPRPAVGASAGGAS